ncbi:hypothetical protein [Ottowia testudinis]|uniref:Uncharacterized protein n=1 Tax=Ottowia testudinis TaxID=2816950 RepID=A0A975CD55_9BURK|nr:hypothetical protein [Ottowia testudinis]QTD44210.1 hypothetical protein J1M35_13885 [Ottowia testudinis]
MHLLLRAFALAAALLPLASWAENAPQPADRALVPFDFPVRPAEQRPSCAFDNLKLPSNARVLAAGAYSGRALDYQIDQSGHQATRIDVAVNSPARPVVLMLGAYEPTVWAIGWSPGTRIAAVLVSGYHRQAVAGLKKTVPVLNSSHDNKGPCGYFYIGDNEQLGRLNPLAQRVFGKPVEMVYPARDGRAALGDPLPEGVQLLTSSATPPDAFRDAKAPLAGPAGIQDAVRRGLLRPATSADADAWAQASARAAPKNDLPPVAGQDPMKAHRPAWRDAYVVLQPMTYPAGLYGAHSLSFVVPKGVPMPTGNPGHSDVYDFNTLSCVGALCRTR